MTPAAGLEDAGRPIARHFVLWTGGRGAEFNIAAHGLRGLASLMVLAAHILGGTARHIYENNQVYVDGVRAPWYLGTFGVQLFFVISGFVILPSALRYLPGEFALRRFLRLYPLFLALTVAFVILNAATNAYPRINNWASVLSGLLFINLFTGTEQITPNAWSLTYEVIFYVLVCAVVHFTMRRRVGPAGIASIVLAAAFVVAFPMAIYFVMGVAIRMVRPARSLPTTVARTLELLSLALTIAFASRGHFEYVWADLANPVVGAIILSTGLYFYFATLPASLTELALGNRVMRYFGTVSYSLYLVHPYTYYVARYAFERLGLFTDNVAGSIGLFALTVFVVTIPATHLVHVTLELWPYRRFFRQGVYRETGPKVAGQSEAQNT